MSALLEARGIRMSFGVAADHEGGSHAVLKGVDLDIHAGERLGVVGRNGAGKSTLLRILGGIYSPQAGAVRMAPGKTAALLSLGLGFQDQLTGRDNAYLGCLLQGLSRADARACIGAIEDFCDLGVYFDEPVKSYSAGMRARLGFGTALYNRADLLLVDETLSVGDRVFRQRAREALNRELGSGRAAVIVSHNEQQLAALCTRVVWLEAGAIRADGDPESVIAAYVDASGDKSTRGVV